MSARWKRLARCADRPFHAAGANPLATMGTQVCVTIPRATRLVFARSFRRAGRARNRRSVF
jgi:hypothetical protein